MRIAVVLDDHALAALPGVEQELACSGALVMRSFLNTPNPQLLRQHAGVAVVGGPDKAGLLARLERATTTLASIPAPVIGVLPRGVAAGRDLLGPGVVDLVPAGAPRAAERILLMAKVPVVTGARAPRAASPAPVRPGGRPPPGPRAAAVAPGVACAGPCDVVAVASSTGGVWVLGALLRELAPEGRAVLVAQHMDAEFVAFFAQWLEGASGWRTVLVEQEAPLGPAAVFLPAGGCDLVVEGERVRAVPSCSRFVPCADRLLASAAGLGPRATGVVLSGMGADGAAGLGELVRRGGYAICQDPCSAVVPSMPESALRAAPGALAVAPEGLAAAIAAQARASRGASARR